MQGGQAFVYYLLVVLFNFKYESLSDPSLQFFNPLNRWIEMLGFVPFLYRRNLITLKNRL